MIEEDFDGFYFLPGEECDDDLTLAYFKFKDGEYGGPSIEVSSLGDKYHIAFFKRDSNGDPMFDDEFEAIFADPSVYIKGLCGAKIYGCVLRKTKDSSKWWKEYLERAQKTCLINKLSKTAQLIADSKT